MGPALIGIGIAALQQAVPLLIKAAAQLALPGAEKHKRVVEALEGLAPDEASKATIPLVVESTYQVLKANQGLESLTEREWKARTFIQLQEVIDQLRQTMYGLQLGSNTKPVNTADDKQQVVLEVIELLDRWATHHQRQGRHTSCTTLRQASDRLAAYYDVPMGDSGPEVEDAASEPAS